MMASRDLNDLTDGVRLRAERFLSLCEGAVLDVLIYCTYRPLREQAVLFRMGRSLDAIRRRADVLSDTWHRPDLADLLMSVGPQHGRRVTGSAPGQSIHYYRRAFDGVPLMGGKAMWSSSTPEGRVLWNQYGALAEDAGLSWSGRWVRGIKEFPHCQQKGFDWRDHIGGIPIERSPA